jgi:hypothetical protein
MKRSAEVKKKQRDQRKCKARTKGNVEKEAKGNVKW